MEDYICYCWVISNGYIVFCLFVGVKQLWLLDVEPMPRLFGQKLRYLREQQKLSQMDVVRQFSFVSQSHLSNLEAGRKAPSLDLVIRVAEVFGVTTDYLLRDTVAVESKAHQLRMIEANTRSKPHLFSSKLRYLRLKAGMTQGDLAQRLALKAHAFVSLLETGRKEPSSTLVLQIADVFGVTADYLLRDSVPVEFK